MRKKIWKILGICAFLLAFILVGIMGLRFYQKKLAEKEYQQMQSENEEKEEQITIIPTPLSTLTPTPVITEPVTTPEAEVTPKPEIPIDFVSLQAKNPDIYAWIKIPGTKIDYPVVQRTSDNSYYLNRTAEGKWSAYGAIFSENYNALDFQDYITVLYGHNMRNGSMFAGLHAYEDYQYMKEHNEIIIYTPDSILKYRIFAAYLTDNRHMLLFYNQGREVKNRTAYLEEILNQRNMNASVDTNAAVDENSKILTLSTCHGAGKNYRFLVQAYLLEE